MNRTLPAQTITTTERERQTLHMAGLGQYRPMGSVPTARADSLVERGFLALNPKTGIYFLTESGYTALAGSN